MALKKMRSKTHKGAKKRIKVTNGGDKSIGKLVTNRIFKNHRKSKRQRERVLKAVRSTTLSAVHKKLKAII
jgi:ribosomal protein L35